MKTTETTPEDSLDYIIRDSLNIVEAALQLAADVRTLNEWQGAVTKPWEVFRCGDGRTACILKKGSGLDGTWIHGPTPEAAIHAAAEAVRKGEAWCSSYFNPGETRRGVFDPTDRARLTFLRAARRRLRTTPARSGP